MPKVQSCTYRKLNKRRCSFNRRKYGNIGVEYNTFWWAISLATTFHKAPLWKKWPRIWQNWFIFLYLFVNSLNNMPIGIHRKHKQWNRSGKLGWSEGKTDANCWNVRSYSRKSLSFGFKHGESSDTICPINWVAIWAKIPQWYRAL